MKISPKAVPKTAGAYFFLDKKKQILYIGKAVNLRSRITSYFNKQPKEPRISRMLTLAAKVNWRETDSEIEALILESQLIKKYNPPFNIMLRDDKQYFYVGITREKFPKIFITHQPFKQVTGYRVQGMEKNTSKYLNPKPYHLDPNYVGPFTDGAALRTTLRLLRRAFPYCTCKQQHNNYCLNYHIGRCLGFCCLKQQNPNFQFSIFNFQKEYGKNIKAIQEILEGRKAPLIKKLKKEMLELGRKHRFDKAIELRDKIEKLEKIFENAQIIHNSYFINLNSKNSVGGRATLKELARVLKISSMPRRIEGYDISNIQGKFATGAMVVFTDGQPDKSQYRKFKIRFVKKPNFALRSLGEVGRMPKGQGGDTAMLKEILVRRFRHPEWPYPDLIVIDGGRGQLNAALEIVGARIRKQELGIIALTKDQGHRGDHIFLDKKKTATPLKSLPGSIRNLILQVDAEAHRFAISYYRKLHRKFTQ